MDAIVTLLVVAKILALVLGSIVALLAYRAYLRTKIDGLQYFAVGLSIITVGTVLVGIFHHLMGLRSVVGMLIESLIISVGFVVVIVGLYGR
ncbi:hypothetical protein MW046_14565 (plasmid) [Halocatena salina]|uniref:Uncharacterized protein n=1 Tax=Halocatena salina TaxID=2934340 RepID=A0A8U0A7U7_9EURY|nr:hypothetical protein [Halocatena salina]UPM44578.1 hypothetical protein MW046_14565 [Halocatena salina]